MRLGDAEAMYSYASDPEVTRYVLWETHGSIEEYENFLRFAGEGYERGDFGGGGLVEGQRGLRGNLRYGGRSRTLTGRARVRAGLEALGKGPHARGVAACGPLLLRADGPDPRRGALLGKAGISYEGTLRRREYIKGAYKDMKMYSTLRGEYVTGPRRQV